MSEILTKAIATVRNASSAFCRFITANDTGENGSHQSGFFISKCAASLLFEEPCYKGENVEKNVEIKWQDDIITNSRFVYYGRRKDEFRITRFGRNFPFLGSDNVGDLLVIAKENDFYYHAFVLKSDQDIDDFFAYFNLSPDKSNHLIDTSQVKDPADSIIEAIDKVVAQYEAFPETKQMAMMARDIYNSIHKIDKIAVNKNPDNILLKWYDTEYCLFRQFEEKVYSPIYRQPFANCQELINFSNAILNRRKSRAGKSLENHLATIFTAADLKYEEQAVTEDNKKPDFLFPGGEAYHNLLFPAEQLVFLGAKTSCKDRWRQVLNEANRIDIKYLFTFQQGVTKNQLLEMRHEKVKLVVPSANRESFPMEFQPEIETLASFIDIVKEKQKSLPRYY